MLLQKLVEFADRLEEKGDLIPPLYSKKWARYQIELDNDGNLLNPHPIDLSEMEDGKKRGQTRKLPHIVKSSGVKPILLADNAEYTFGLRREAPKEESEKKREAGKKRVKKCKVAYENLMEKCVKDTQDPVISAVLTFLQDDPLSKLEIEEDFDRSGNIIFRVGDKYAHEQRSVREFWVKYNAPKQKKKAKAMQCFICGEEKPILKRLPGKIIGVPNGHKAGTSIISANTNAFESYGLEASQIAPTCIECADRFTKALNYLLDDDSHHVWFSSLIFAFWTRNPVEYNWATVIKEPDSQAIHELINSVRSSKWNPDVDDTEFYAVSLSGSGGRTVVRDWMDTTVGKVKKNLANWFENQKIVGTWGDESRPLGVYALAGAAVRDLKDVPTPTYQALLRAGISNTPLPLNLLEQAVRRCRAERTVTHPRAALIKLVMKTQNIIKENDMVQLQTDHPEAGYHCGRLLAVLENIQRESAKPTKLNTTIIDRFYGTASTAPASVFGRLVKGAQSHLSKIRRRKDNAAEYALQERLEEILTTLSEISSPASFPTTLNLNQQGFFALGYYHQRADDRAQMRNRITAKEKTASEA